MKEGVIDCALVMILLTPPEYRRSKLGKIILCPHPCSSTSPSGARFGHSLEPGGPQTVGVEALHASTGSGQVWAGMGHLLISCGSCHDELRSTTFYEPPRDIRYR